MEKFYFTFGSDPGFPYQNTYLIVYAKNLDEAIEKFRAKHPDRHLNCVNCAFFYEEAVSYTHLTLPTILLV